jgi:hypothetical protein
MRILTRHTAITLAALALSACDSGHHGQSSAAAASAAARAAAKAAPSSGATLSRNMVSAVTAVKPGSTPLPVQVKFEITQRPEVGQPLEVNIAFIPTTPNFDRMTGQVQGEDGLELVGPAELTAAEKPTEGVPVQHTVKVVPKSDGIYNLTVTVSCVDTAGQVSAQAYEIPIIAGQGFADLPAAPAPVAAKTAASAAPPKR